MNTYSLPRHARAAIAAAAALTSLAAWADPPIPVGMTVNPWTKVFEDNFDGTAIDTVKWTYRGDVSNNLSWQKAANVSLDGNGMMRIGLVRNDPSTSPSAPYGGGGLISTQHFRYGYYETRAQMNPFAGWHSAFWMMDWDPVNQQSPPTRSTEIDGFEIDSVTAPTELFKIRHNVITWYRGTNTRAPFYKTTDKYNSGLDLRQFHIYAVDWSEAGVQYYIDGNPVNWVNASPAASGFQAYPPSAFLHDPLRIWLSTIAYNGTPAVDTSAPYGTAGTNYTQWDYVRYWQKDFYVDNKSTAASGIDPNGGPDGVYAETSGAWLDSGLSGWTAGSPTRYAACGAAGATATWTPDLKAAGTYEVFVWNVVNANSDTNARWDVIGAGAATPTYVNGTSGASAWVSLGTFSMPQGTSVSVQVTSSGSGCARADAVKFVRRS